MIFDNETLNIFYSSLKQRSYFWLNVYKRTFEKSRIKFNENSLGLKKWLNESVQLNITYVRENYQ